MRLLTVICVAALVVAFCAPAFAETQNVKLSGDIKVSYIYQKNLDLNKDTASSDADNFFMQQVGLNVDADLTDNVSTFVRLVNERDWDTADVDNKSVNLDEAYVTLKEFLYAPLTLKVGRQDMWFGKGLIIGTSGLWDTVNVQMGADELSEFNAFDAVRATLDYDPWTMDLAYAKISDTTLNQSDDIDLYGINAGYVFNSYDAEAEAYYWCQYDQSVKPDIESSRTHTLGLRGSFIPYENMNIWAEGAMQLGRYYSADAPNKTEREAWALDVGIDYTFVDCKWTPKAGAEYQYLSGDDYETTGDYTGWNPMYKGKADSYIREYMDVLYATSYAAGITDRNRLDGNTNQHQIKGMLAIEPMPDVTLDGSLSYFMLDKEISAARTSDDIGLELDGKLTYDYTEDVSFIVKGGIFWAGDAYSADNDDSASKIISAVSVDF